MKQIWINIKKCKKLYDYITKEKNTNIVNFFIWYIKKKCKKKITSVINKKLNNL